MRSSSRRRCSRPSWQAQSAPPSARPSLSPSTIPPPSLVPGNFVICPACGLNVPLAKFCCRMRGTAPSAERTARPPAVLARAFAGGRRSSAGSRACDGSSATRSRVPVWWEIWRGKTRLLKEFSLRAESEGDLAIWAGPDPYWAEIPCYALRTVIPELARLTDGDLEAGRYERANSDARRGLEEIMAGVPRADERRTPAERRHALAEALRWAVLRSSELRGSQQRIILVVDELHRVDGPSRFAIADLLADPPGVRLLVLGAHAPGYDPGWGAACPVRVLGAFERSGARAVGARGPGERRAPRGPGPRDPASLCRSAGPLCRGGGRRTSLPSGRSDRPAGRAAGAELAPRAPGTGGPG